MIICGYIGIMENKMETTGIRCYDHIWLYRDDGK